MIWHKASDKAKQNTDQALNLREQVEALANSAEARVCSVVVDFKASVEFAELKRSLLRAGQKYGLNRALQASLYTY